MSSSFAIIPAAGRSRRMGTSKLLLPWKDHTVIQQVLETWQASRVNQLVVVVAPHDQQLADVCRHAGIEPLVAPMRPVEMKATVCFALDEVRIRFNPQPTDVWLLAPADIPGLSYETINQLLAAHLRNPSAILLPTHGGQRSHPALFPWPLASEVARLPPGWGVNRMLDRHEVQELPCDAPLATDIDTLDQYRAQRDNGTDRS